MAGELTAAYVLEHPADSKSLVKYCHQRSRAHLDEVVATLDAIWALPPINVALRTTQCALLLLYKEEWGRRRRGLPTQNAADLADMKFRFMAAEAPAFQQLACEWLAVKPTSTPARTMLALATLAAETPQQAEPHFAALRALKTGDPHAVTNFDRAFHATLEAAADAGESALPEVVKVAEAEPAERIVYAACDYAFFQAYTWALAGSFLGQATPGVTLHLHLFDILDDELESLRQTLGPAVGRTISLSREWTNLRPAAPTPLPKKAKAYYHIARFHRFWSHLKNRPMATGWLMDGDLMFNQSPMALFKLIGDKDAGLWLLPGRLEPYNKMIAGLVGISPTPQGRRYLHRVAGYVADCVRADTIPWGTDQVILYCVYMDMIAHHGLDVAAVSPEISNGRWNEAAAIWPLKCDPGTPEYPVLQRRLEMLKAA